MIGTRYYDHPLTRTEPQHDPAEVCRRRRHGGASLVITDEELTRQVEPNIAVERALNATERQAFMEYQLVGFYDGAQIADWISDAADADKYLEIVEKWWERAGDAAVAYLMTLHELPEPLTRSLLGAALYATCGIGAVAIGPEPWSVGGRRTHIEIASGAALYARGYAEALGWRPHQ